MPFSPNITQREAIRQIARFVWEPTGRDRAFVLRGYAGTGKTSLVGALVQVMAELKMPVHLMAPTGRAAKVLAAMAGRPAYTIHKTIYRLQKFGPTMEDFSLVDNRARSCLFICDEASMISTTSESTPWGRSGLLDDMIEYVYAGQGCRLLLVGDGAQLPPVGQHQSPALVRANLEAYGLEVTDIELTEVARQQLDSGILLNATLLRRRLMAGEVNGLPRIHYIYKDDVVRTDSYELLECLSDSYRSEGLDETIIITRSNKRANIFNLGVRNQILEMERELSSDDRLLVVKNNYYWAKQFDQLPFIANGDVVRVRRVRSTTERYGFRFATVEVTLPDYDIETEVLVLLDTLTAEGPALSQAQMQQLYLGVATDYPHLHNQRDLAKAIKENPYYNALQVKYAYCVTCHKSQGGQWQHVYLDLGYINPEHLGEDFYRWMYTAFTRARQTIYLVNMSDEMAADADELTGLDDADAADDE